jgi:hypothetical protein
MLEAVSAEQMAIVEAAQVSQTSALLQHGDDMLFVL